jgi:hypothetical protein
MKSEFFNLVNSKCKRRKNNTKSPKTTNLEYKESCHKRVFKHSRFGVCICLLEEFESIHGRTTKGKDHVKHQKEAKPTSGLE